MSDRIGREWQERIGTPSTEAGGEWPASTLQAECECPEPCLIDHDND